MPAPSSARGCCSRRHSHILRHTFGTELTRSGVDIVTVAELMGHASLETARIYTRPTNDDMQRAVEGLSADDEPSASFRRWAGPRTGVGCGVVQGFCQNRRLMSDHGIEEAQPQEEQSCAQAPARHARGTPRALRAR